MMDQLRRSFDQIFAEYNNQTEFCSSSHHMRRQPAYTELIDLGEDIIPYLLEELGGEEFGISTQIILHDLSRADPTSAARDQIADTAMASIDVVTAARLWRSWGREQGYQFT